MTRDFTFDIYEQLLQVGLDAGYEHITVREYLSSGELPERFIIHRHDVDRKPENALAMAQLEAEYDIPSTYYFRTIEKTFKPDMISEIEELGHEIGYHYEDMDRAGGDVSEAHESFADEIDRIREYAMIDTICMHGNPLTAYDNRNMWSNEYGFERYDLLGEAYLSIDFANVTYFSDTGRTWEDGALKIKDHTMGEGVKEITAKSTPDLLEILRAQRIQRICILSHPNRWANGFLEYMGESSKDAMINLGKRGLNLFRGTPQ